MLNQHKKSVINFGIKSCGEVFYMTYFDLRDLQKQIHAQKLKVAQMRENATKTEFSVISDMPKGKKVSDKLSETICNILYEEQILYNLEKQLKNSVKSIPSGLMREIIKGRLNGWSWTKIAYTIGGNNTADSVRMMCTRYKW